MSLCKIQGKAEKRRGIFYEFDSSEEPLGVGGMGKVYKGYCVDELTGHTRQVAIKFMYNDLPGAAIERARREASIQIHNDNLVEMLGFIETEERDVLGTIQRYYHVVSELLEGVMLDDLLQGKLLDRSGNLVPFAQKLYNDYQRDGYRFAIYIIRNILSGLMALHDAGYIHRDIDPTNIMITSDGHVKLIDFGIAKQMRSLTSHDKSLTVAGVFMGKPEYAAPELVLGDIKSQDQTTDIYSVGILLFQCIVGHPPFEGDRHEVLAMQLHKKMPLHLIKNKGIRKIIETATDKSRAKRFQSAAEFRVALERLPIPLKDDVFEWKTLYTIICSIVVACTIVAAGLLYSFQPESSPVVHYNAFTRAVECLYNDKKAQEGMEILDSLSEAGNADASYLLSRLYFQSYAAQDFCPDTIKEMKRHAKVVVNNAKAHELLELTIRQDSSYYRALYELASDYYGGGNRSLEYSRDTEKSLQLFKRALVHAKKAKDNEFVSRIQSRMQVLEEKMKDAVKP